MALIWNLPAITEQEHATILAALRFYQKSYNIREQAIDEIATNVGEFSALGKTGIDILCERINTESVYEGSR
jgi:hypothetical protein